MRAGSLARFVFLTALNAEPTRSGLMAPPLQVPNAPLKLTPLRELSRRYDAVLCDIWGVLHDGQLAFADAVDALRQYRAGGGSVMLITNAPRSSKDIYPQLARLGVPRDAFDGIVTSGDVTARLIAKSPDSPVFHFGPDRDRSILEGLANPLVDLARSKLCLLTGPLDDAIPNVDVYEHMLVQMRDRDVKMICANPDLVVRSGDRMVICAGSIAKRYAQLGGSVLYAGKPEAAIYEEALRKVAHLEGRAVPKDRILAIGDGLQTDIKGAAQNGFDACFITGGIHSDDFKAAQTSNSTANSIARIERQWLSLGVVGICDRLRWT